MKIQVKEFYGSSVFSKYGLIVLPFVLIFSFVYGLREFIWISLSCLIILLFSRLWAAWSLKNLVIEESISAREVFPGEETHVQFKVSNNKRLPVAWLNLESGDFQKESEGLDRGEFEEQNGNENQEFTEAKSNPLLEKETEGPCKFFQMGWISGQDSLIVKQTFKLLRRGVYKVGTSKIRSGDPFSLFCSERSIVGSTEVWVYPPLLDFPWLDFERRHPNGNRSDRNVVFTDPAYKIGLKEYEPSDSIRSINWAVSARYQALKANIAEGKAVSRYVLFLNASNSLSKKWPKEKESLALEILVSGVASLAFHLSSVNKEWSFSTNVLEKKAQPHRSFASEITSSSSHHQLRLLLARLACLNVAPGKIEIAADHLLRVKKQSGVTLILFSVAYDPKVKTEILKKTQFKHIKWYVLEEDHITEGTDVYALKPGWTEDNELYQQFMG